MKRLKRMYKSNQVLSQESEEKIYKVLDSLEDAIRQINKPEERKLSSYLLKNPFFSYRKRYESDLTLVAQIFKKGQILEVGSSPYHLTYCLKMLGYRITGVDVNPKVLKQFQKKHDLKIIN